MESIFTSKVKVNLWKKNTHPSFSSLYGIVFFFFSFSGFVGFVLRERFGFNKNQRVDWRKKPMKRKQ